MTHGLYYRTPRMCHLINSQDNVIINYLDSLRFRNRLIMFLPYIRNPNRYILFIWTLSRFVTCWSRVHLNDNKNSLINVETHCLCTDQPIVRLPSLATGKSNVNKSSAIDRTSSGLLFLVSCFSTFAVWDFTLPARAREPCTLPWVTRKNIWRHNNVRN